MGLKLEGLQIPVIAAVNGFALGGGWKWPWPAISSTPRRTPNSASRRSTWGSSRASAAPSACPAWWARAWPRRCVLTGRLMDAPEAKALGLVARVFPADTFMEDALKVARSLAAKGRVALRGIKRAIDRGFDLDLRAPAPWRWTPSPCALRPRTPSKGPGPSWRSASRSFCKLPDEPVS